MCPREPTGIYRHQRPSDPANQDYGSNGDERIRPLATEIANLGGYWETIVYLSPTDTYSLVELRPASFRGRRTAKSPGIQACLPRSPNGRVAWRPARGRATGGPLNADPSGQG